MQFKPADESVVPAKFYFLCFLQAAPARAQPVMRALPASRKNAKARHAGRVSHRFDDTGKEGVDVLEAQKNPREAQDGGGRKRVAFEGRFDMARWLGSREEPRFFTQVAVFFAQPQIIKGTADQRLKTPAVNLQIFGGVDAGLFGIAKGLRARSAEGDHEDIGPRFLDLRQKILRFPRAQVEQKKSWAGLPEDSAETTWIGYVS
jgi:hypothetical protein